VHLVRSAALWAARGGPRREGAHYIAKNRPFRSGHHPNRTGQPECHGTRRRGHQGSAATPTRCARGRVGPRTRSQTGL